MTHKVRIPYVLVVRKVTWRPAGEPMPVDATPQLTVANGVSLPIEDMNLHIDPATYDALVEQGKREYYAEKAAEAKAARAAEEAKWEPMPIPPGASRPLAALYGNMRRRKQPEASEPAYAADAVADLWAGWGEMAGPVDAAAASNASATDPTSGEDAAQSSAAGLDALNEGSKTNATQPSSQRLDQTSVGGSKPAADGGDLSLLTGLDYPSLGGTSKSDAVQYASNGSIQSDAVSANEQVKDSLAAVKNTVWQTSASSNGDENRYRDMFQLVSEKPGIIQFEYDPDNPFRATPSFVSRFRGSQEEIDVFAAIIAISVGSYPIREYLNATDRKVQLPGSRDSYYEIYAVGRGGRIAHAEGSTTYYYSPEHYGMTSEAPNSWIALKYEGTR